ncbi:MAG: glycosyltransferase family 4 protein [Oscillospiraceae bacterium]|nr:glycosyltransferase family 4 protein [Oscillospiraceae bacterium]
MARDLQHKPHLKIAIIGHKRIPSNEGGIEKGVEEHAVRMAALGHDVTVYNRGDDNIHGKAYNEERLKEYKGVRIITVPTPNGGASVPVYSFLATVHALFQGYDVVSYRASGPCVMIALAKLFGLRCVASLHGFDSQRDKWGRFARWYLALGEKIAARRADVCLVLSRRMQQYIRDTYHRQALCFANGISRPERREAQEITEKWGLTASSYILSLGRVEPEKGLHYLIEAFRRCDTDKKLVIAGGDSNHDYYARLRQMAQGDDRILFIGAVKGNTIAELYSNAYLFTLPSNLEGMANTLLESMSYGCCCLVSDIAENTEVVGDKAVTFPKGDVDALTEKLQWLLRDEAAVAGYSAQAADYIVDKYNWDLVVAQMLRVYRGEMVEYSQVWRESHGEA